MVSKFNRAKLIVVKMVLVMLAVTIKQICKDERRKWFVPALLNYSTNLDITFIWKITSVGKFFIWGKRLCSDWKRSCMNFKIIFYCEQMLTSSLDIFVSLKGYTNYNFDDNKHKLFYFTISLVF